jgi:hypothetical protein
MVKKDDRMDIKECGSSPIWLKKRVQGFQGSRIEASRL